MKIHSNRSNTNSFIGDGNESSAHEEFSKKNENNFWRSSTQQDNFKPFQVAAAGYAGASSCSRPSALINYKKCSELQNLNLHVAREINSTKDLPPGPAKDLLDRLIEKDYDQNQKIDKDSTLAERVEKTIKPLSKITATHEGFEPLNFQFRGDYQKDEKDPYTFIIGGTSPSATGASAGSATARVSLATSPSEVADIQKYDSMVSGLRPDLSFEFEFSPHGKYTGFYQGFGFSIGPDPKGLADSFDVDGENGHGLFSKSSNNTVGGLKVILSSKDLTSAVSSGIVSDNNSISTFITKSVDEAAPECTLNSDYVSSLISQGTFRVRVDIGASIRNPSKMVLEVRVRDAKAGAIDPSVKPAITREFDPALMDPHKMYINFAADPGQTSVPTKIKFLNFFPSCFNSDGKSSAGGMKYIMPESKNTVERDYNYPGENRYIKVVNDQSIFVEDIKKYLSARDDIRSCQERDMLDYGQLTGGCGSIPSIYSDIAKIYGRLEYLEEEGITDGLKMPTRHTKEILELVNYDPEMRQLLVQFIRSVNEANRNNPGVKLLTLEDFLGEEESVVKTVEAIYKEHRDKSVDGATERNIHNAAVQEVDSLDALRKVLLPAN